MRRNRKVGAIVTDAATLAQLLEDALEVGICLTCGWSGEDLQTHFAEHTIRRACYLIDDTEWAPRAYAGAAEWLEHHGVGLRGSASAAPPSNAAMPIEGAFHAHTGWQFKRDPERADHSLEVVMFKDGVEVARFDAATWASIYESVSAYQAQGDVWRMLLEVVTGWPPNPSWRGASAAERALREMVMQIIAESPPDDWRYHEHMLGYLGYGKRGAPDFVDEPDESNFDDVHAHGAAVGAWRTARRLRAALAGSAGVPK